MHIPIYSKKSKVTSSFQDPIVQIRFTNDMVTQSQMATTISYSSRPYYDTVARANSSVGKARSKVYVQTDEQANERVDESEIDFGAYVRGPKARMVGSRHE